MEFGFVGMLQTSKQLWLVISTKIQEWKSTNRIQPNILLAAVATKNPKMAVFGQTPATTQSLQLDLAAGLLGLQPHQSTYSDTD